MGDIHSIRTVAVSPPPLPLVVGLNYSTKLRLKHGTLLPGSPAPSTRRHLLAANGQIPSGGEAGGPL